MIDEPYNTLPFSGPLGSLSNAAIGGENSETAAITGATYASRMARFAQTAFRGAQASLVLGVVLGTEKIVDGREAEGVGQIAGSIASYKAGEAHLVAARNAPSLLARAGHLVRLASVSSGAGTAAAIAGTAAYVSAEGLYDSATTERPTVGNEDISELRTAIHEHARALEDAINNEQTLGVDYVASVSGDKQTANAIHVVLSNDRQIADLLIEGGDEALSQIALLQGNTDSVLNNFLTNKSINRFSNASVTSEVVTEIKTQMALAREEEIQYETEPAQEIQEIPEIFVPTPDMQPMSAPLGELLVSAGDTLAVSGVHTDGMAYNDQTRQNSQTIHTAQADLGINTVNR